MEAKERIIVALDVSDIEEAIDLVSELKDYVGMFKVGLELLSSQGAPNVVRLIKNTGGKVFLDGKFHDIPNTVAGATKAVVNLGVDMFNVHASGGVDMMRAAADHRVNSILLAVTVLTSLSDEDARMIYGKEAKAKVIEYAILAKKSGVNGLICSAKEIKTIRSRPGLDSLMLVTPGIRPKWASKGDQKRIMTPAEAIEAGADYLVIGRPIRTPPSEIGGPRAAAEKIAIEIKEGLERRSK